MGPSPSTGSVGTDEIVWGLAISGTTLVAVLENGAAVALTVGTTTIPNTFPGKKDGVILGLDVATGAYKWHKGK